jgi:iron complex transport system substrate-binding protein
MTRLICILVFVSAAWSSYGWASIFVTDARGVVVSLERPATRIISLAPHVTELLFAAGAGDSIIGAMEYSDYPPEALRIPRIGSASRVDMERIVALNPDLIVAWQSGNAAADIRRLETLGFPVFVTEPHRLESIGEDIRRLGELAGTLSTAAPTAASYLDELTALRMAHAARQPVAVFFQIWNQPLMTINGEHMINDVISLCGGQNVFADIGQLAPAIAIESVLAKNPDVIIVLTAAGTPDRNLDSWRKWPQLTAVRQGNLFAVDRDLVARHTPRLLAGIKQVCDRLDEARLRASGMTRKTHRHT